MDKEKVLYAINIKSVVTTALIGIALGCVLTFVPMTSLVNWLLVIIAILVIAYHGFALYMKSVVNKEESSNEMLLDVLGILVGFLLLVFHGLAMIIIASIYLLVDPILYLALSHFDKKLMVTELPKIGLGIVLLLGGVAQFNILFKIVGIVVLVLSIGYLVVNYVLYKKSGIKILEG